MTLFPDEGAANTDNEGRTNYRPNLTTLHRGVHRTNAPESSKWAAARVNPLQWLDVLAFLRARGAFGATDEETALALGIRNTSAGARRNTLMRNGLVEWAGTHRRGTSGRYCRVWRMTEPATKAEKGGAR